MAVAKNTPPKTNMDTQNYGLEKVSPFKSSNFLYPCLFSGVYALRLSAA